MPERAAQGMQSAVDLNERELVALKALAQLPTRHKGAIWSLRREGLLPDGHWSPTLGRLYRRGLVDCETQFDNAADNPYIYWLTDEGRAALREVDDGE